MFIDEFALSKIQLKTQISSSSAGATNDARFLNCLFVSRAPQCTCFPEHLVVASTDQVPCDILNDCPTPPSRRCHVHMYASTTAHQQRPGNRTQITTIIDDDPPLNFPSLLILINTLRVLSAMYKPPPTGRPLSQTLCCPAPPADPTSCLRTAQGSKQSGNAKWGSGGRGGGRGGGGAAAASSSSPPAGAGGGRMKYVPPPSSAAAAGSPSSVSPPGKMKYVAPPTNAGEWNRPKVCGQGSSEQSGNMHTSWASLKADKAC